MTKPEINFGLLTVSDRCSRGETLDESGALLLRLVNGSERWNCSTVVQALVEDDQSKITEKLTVMDENERVHVIITTGGTGFSPRDVTPEATLALIERRCNGLEHALFAESLRKTPMAALSRSVCGITRRQKLIVNMPGKPKAVEECFAVIEPLLLHAVALLREVRCVSEKQHEEMRKADV